MLNEDQVNIARELIAKKYPLRKLPIEDVISCCCCVRYWRKRRDLGDTKLNDIKSTFIEESGVELDDYE